MCKENFHDCVFIDGIELPCRIGVTEEERSSEQLVRVSVRAYMPLAKAGATDDLAHTIDYASLHEKISELACSKPFNLVEALIENIAEITLRMGNVESVWVRAEKRVFAGTNCVGAEISRQRADQGR